MFRHIHIYVYTVILTDDKQLFWVLYCHCSITCDFPSMFKVGSSQLSQIFSCHQLQHQHHRIFIGSKIMLCIWWDQKGLVYYKLLKPDDSVTGDRYRLRLIDPCIVWAVHCKKNGWNTGKDVIKLFFFMTTLGLMSLKSKKIWKRSNGMFYPTRRILRTLLLITDYSEECSKLSVHFFRRNRKLAPKLDRLQRRVIFSRWNSKIAWKMGKNSRQRWTIL